MHLFISSVCCRVGLLGSRWARRLGYGDDIDDGGSDRLIDAAFAWGDASSIASRVREHLDAGADHVCVQVISGRDDDACLPALRELAGALL